ncbi:unnamed protein product [Allacma fusca]|uniref:Uncharacterized protein n=1 Tax=Allacma fusca TaxID=39272 RepID=A0A8J2NHK1_9HEXA|nr:unnamed protein product [Allacma fusca]
MTLLLEYSQGIKCLECVYVESLTDNYCLYARKNVSNFQVDCTEKYEKENGNTELYNYCEIAWGCYKKGYEKFAALHRTCSLGLAYSENGNETSDSKYDDDVLTCERIQSVAGEVQQGIMLKTVCSFSPIGVLLNRGLVVVSFMNLLLNERYM